ncbi:peptidoglycan bridge formation glycyltransferase FemA/FemB family protein [candidate division WOR-3 bacterium]|nr:peptidoglycan bridge formation glycyltransferase FemA/FemB family protein [candidate division WOR-3 bacterium]
MQVKIIDPSKYKRWDEFVDNHPQGTVFHLSNWARVIQKSYGYIPYYFILEDSNKKIKAGCPFFLIKSWLTGNRLVCLPFSDYCDPLIDSKQSLDLLLGAIKNYVKDSTVIQLRTLSTKNLEKDIFLKQGFSEWSYYKTFLINLCGGLELVRKRFDRKAVRQAITKSIRSGVHIERGNTEGDLVEHYKLITATRKKLGVIPQPYRFFQNLWQIMITKNLGFLLLAKYNGIPVASAIFLTYKGTIFPKFNGSDQRFLNLQPNNLLYWSAIEWGVKNGYACFDFGRTSPDNSGLIAFKRRWGTEERDLSYYYWPVVKGITSTELKSLKYRMITSVLRRTPTVISRAAGELLYKHLG